jgi:hypothetical protein
MTLIVLIGATAFSTGWFGGSGNASAVGVVNVGPAVSAQGVSSPASITGSISGLTLVNKDLLVAVASFGETGQTVSSCAAPSGWTAWPGSSVGSGQANAICVWYSVYTDSSPTLSSFVLTLNGGQVYAYVRIFQLRGENPTAPNDRNLSNAQGTSASTLSSAAVTPSIAGDKLFVIWEAGNMTVSSISPSGLNGLWSDPNYNGADAAFLDVSPVVGSATTAYQATFGGTYDSANAVQLLVAPGN